MKVIMKNIPLFLFVFSVITAIINIVFFQAEAVESFLVCLLVINYGFGGIWAFIGHYFLSDKVAESIGWPINNPFQKEVAFTSLAFGIVAILAIAFRGDYLIAAVLTPSIFLLGAASIHIKEIIKNKNMSSGNAGPILYISDILVPLALIILLLFYKIGV